MKITIDDRHLNEPMKKGMKKTISAAKHAHFTNVKIRINGEWREYEADWIKHIKIDE